LRSRLFYRHFVQNLCAAQIGGASPAKRARDVHNGDETAGFSVP
jgi:hypothetical protein